MTYEWPTVSKATGDGAAREQRTSKLVTLEMSSARHDRTKIVVRNISPHGLGVRADIELLPCERIIIHLPGDREVAATVRWARKNQYGLSLDERIEPEALQPKATAQGALTTRDAVSSFTPMRHIASTARTGFQRSHRDEVLKTSKWMSD